MKIAILGSARTGSTSLYLLIENHLRLLPERYMCISEPFNYDWRNRENLETYDINFFENKKNVFIKTFVTMIPPLQISQTNYNGYWDWFFNYFDKIILLDRKNKKLQSESYLYHSKKNNQFSWHQKQFYNLDNIKPEELSEIKQNFINESEIIKSHADNGFPLFYFEDIYVNKNKNKVLELFDYIGIKLNNEFYDEFVLSDVYRVRLTEEDLKLEKSKVVKFI